MQLDKNGLPVIRDTSFPVTKQFIQTILEEKLSQFGFVDTGNVVIKLDADIPETFMVRVKHQKEKEVKVVRHTNGKELPKREQVGRQSSTS